MLKKNKTALITGVSGQDGAYLSKFLLNKNYRIIGCDRRTSGPSLWRLEYLDILDNIEIETIDLLEYSSLQRIIENNDIDEIYNLGAQSFVQASFDVPVYTAKVNAVSVLHLLELIRIKNPKIKFYQASTSEMFGKVSETPQNEQSSFNPRSPYAISKIFSHYSVANYRDAYNLFACSGICFNHESPLRGEEFVTKKIVKGFNDIFNGRKSFVELGNINAKRDWGYAGDYVEAMWLMLQNKEPKDYVISTGVSYSVKEFLIEAAKLYSFNLIFKGTGANLVGIDKNTNNTIIKISSKYYRPTEVDILKGDNSQIYNDLGWAPKTSFKDLVKEMVDYEKKQK